MDTTSLLRGNRDFRLMWVGQGLSKMGSQITAIALPLYVLGATASTVQAGLVEFVFGLSFLVAMLPAGYLADRVSRRALMLVGDLAGAGVSGALGVAVITGHQMPFPLLLVLLGAGGLLGSVFHPAAAASLRRVVPDRDIAVAIARNQTRNQVVYLCGPIVGGLLFGLSPSLPFLVNAASCVVSLLTVLALRTPLGGGGAEPVDSRWWAVVDMVAGVRFLAGLRFVRVCLPVAAILNAVFEALILVVIAGGVQAGETSLSTGLVVSCAAIGSLVGTLIVPLARRATPRTLFLALVWTCAAATSAMAVSTGPLSRAVLIGLVALLAPVGTIAIVTALTVSTPDRLQGRVQSATGFIALGVAPLGPVSAGLLLAHLRPASTFLIYAALLACAGLVATVDRGLHAIPHSGSTQEVTSHAGAAPQAAEAQAA